MQDGPPSNPPRRTCFDGLGLLILLATLSVTPAGLGAEPLERIRVSADGTHFVRGDADERFVVWGVNYDHDRAGRLLDEYWIDEWDTVVQDFQEIKALGANCVRVHLQLGLFMDGVDEPNERSIEQWAKLVRLAEETGLYLDVTGLACYHKKNIPAWFDELSESDRWSVQARFWKRVARASRNSPAIFCYDLMNEPILPGKVPETDWLAGEFAGKHFVQRISLDLMGRSREQVAADWVNRMVDAIRSEDSAAMITVGVIPWVFVFGGGKPLFYDPAVGTRLDFVAVHFYPESGKVDRALDALRHYDVGKPIVVEEMFPLKCRADELEQFVRASAPIADGWVSFYWGATEAELLSQKNPTIAESITGVWLKSFRRLADEFATKL